MKALILSGGRGNRLRPITSTSPKQLVPVANKPVLYFCLEAVTAARITDVGIIVGQSGAEISEAVGDGSRWGARVTYIRQEAPLGLAHAVLVAREFLGEDDFVMYLGDNFIAGGIREIVDDFRRLRPDAQILLAKVADPTAFGVAELDCSGRLVGLEEKPAYPRSDLAMVGVYIFTPAIHEAVRAIRPSWRGELEICDAIGWLLGRGAQVRPTLTSGYWKDTGNVSDMLEVNRLVLETIEARVDGKVDAASEIIGRVRIEAGAEIRCSRIVGPAIIGADAVVQGSYVGPFTSIARRCRIENSEIEFSIVLEDSSIEGVRRIEASLIGRNVTVLPAPRVPSSHCLVLGDYSKVQISR